MAARTVGVLHPGEMGAAVAAVLRGSGHHVLSVAPPHAAVEVARSVSGFEGVFVDANAVSPATAREVAEVVEAGGGKFVDGGIVGSARGPEKTRLYLSGEAAAIVADLFAGSAPSGFHEAAAEVFRAVSAELQRK